MRIEFTQLYVKDNDEWLYNFIEKKFSPFEKELFYSSYGEHNEKEIKKYIKNF